MVPFHQLIDFNLHVRDSTELQFQFSPIRARQIFNIRQSSHQVLFPSDRGSSIARLPVVHDRLSFPFLVVRWFGWLGGALTIRARSSCSSSRIRSSDRRSA